MNIIEIENINKSFTTQKVLHAISMQIPKGQIFGLLGPNGAGKTTLMRILTRIMVPDSGTILINKEPFSKAHVRDIGYMPEERGLYRNMKVAEQLRYIAKLHGIDKTLADKSIKSWLEKFGLTELSQRYVGDLSKGLSQKVQFIATILHNPSILILDEPFSGLDPISSQALEAAIKQIQKIGVTIIMSTHRMDQIENFCDSVFLINKGQKVLEGKIADLKKKYKEGIFQVTTANNIPEQILEQHSITAHNENTYFFKAANDDMKNKLLSDLLNSQTSIISFSEVLPTMQQIFIKSVNAHLS